VPPDIEIPFEYDPSVYVKTRRDGGLLIEGDPGCRS